MISYIKGKILEKCATHVVIENNNIGFQVWITLNGYENMGNPGDDALIHTYLHVREDALQLFGFVDRNERVLFLHLISVSGIGPKLALGILSGLSPSEFRQAVLSQNLELLCTAPGVGKKTGQRLILELKDKLGDEFSEEEKIQGAVKSGAEEAVQALESLGFREAEAQKRVAAISREEPGLTIEEVVRKALKQMR